MQEEITKHTRKIYHTMKSPGHSFFEKLKEIVIEIFIIVFAVSLSIWFHGWSDHRREQAEAAEFLKGLKEDLEKDIRQLENNGHDKIEMDSNYKFIQLHANDRVKDTAIDKEVGRRLYYDLHLTRVNSARYEGFKSSGKMETIDNDSLKQNILEYYQQVMPDISYSETVINSFQTKLLDLQLDKDFTMSTQDFVRKYKVRAILQLGSGNIEGVVKSYEKAIKLAKRIIAQVDKS